MLLGTPTDPRRGLLRLEAGAAASRRKMEGGGEEVRVQVMRTGTIPRWSYELATEQYMALSGIERDATEWHDLGWYDLDVTAEHLRMMAQSFLDLQAEHPGHSLPAYIGHWHDGATPSAGWVSALEVEDDALYAWTQWSERGAKVIAADEYRYTSTEWDYFDADGNRIDAWRVDEEPPASVEWGSYALVNDPAFRGMARLAAHRLAASRTGAPMPRAATLVALAAAVQAADDATDEQIATAALARIGEMERKLAEADVRASRTQARSDFAGLVAAGRATPAQEEPYVALTLAGHAKHAEAMLAAAGTYVGRAIGHDGGAAPTDAEMDYAAAGKALDAAARKLAAEQRLPYVAAFEAACASNPVSAARYASGPRS